MPKLKATPGAPPAASRHGASRRDRPSPPPAPERQQDDLAERGGQCQVEGRKASTAPTTSASRTEMRPLVIGRCAVRFDMAVEIPVGHVVDAAAGAAHQDGAEQEDKQQMPARPAAGSDPERRQRGPEQQQPASRPVPADQIEVERELDAPFGSAAALSGSCGRVVGRPAVRRRRWHCAARRSPRSA